MPFLIELYFRIVIGVWQHIVYNEYLPALLGPVATDHFKLSIKPGRKEVPDYNENLSATMTNVFASAAFRLGHSQVMKRNNNYISFSCRNTCSLLFYRVGACRSSKFDLR